MYGPVLNGISISRSPVEITRQHYFLWQLTLWALLLCFKTHYDITMANVIARDIHCDVTMSNDIAMCTYHGITMHNDVSMRLFYYVLLCPIMILLLSQQGL